MSERSSSAALRRDDSLRTQQAETGELAVRERAVVAAGLSFTITDPHQPDNPLVSVNPVLVVRLLP